MRRALTLVVALLVAGGCAAPSTGSDAEVPSPPLLVAAASDLRPAFEELGRRFSRDTGTPVTFDFGASGQLAQRIIEGAPVDVFASADAGTVDLVLAEGRGDPATRRTYALGHLVLWTAASDGAPWERLEDLASGQAIVAIANPEHAPYGRAAEQALASAGVLDALGDRLVLGENAADAQRLVETGNADVGVIAGSLAAAAEERGVGTTVAVDPGHHDPLVQDLLVTATTAARADAARAFVELVLSADGRAVLERYGLRAPQEAAP